MINFQVKLWAVLLAVCGVVLCWYKVVHIGLPLLPSGDEPVYTVELRSNFTGRGEPVNYQLALPTATPGFIPLDEDFVASGYGLNVEHDETGRSAVWAAREVRGSQVIYYHAAFARAPANDAPLTEVAVPAKPDYLAPVAAAVMDVLAETRAFSADPATFTVELIRRFNAEQPSPSMQLIRRRGETRQRRAELLVEMLLTAGLEARLVLGVELGQHRSASEIDALLQVYSTDERAGSDAGKWLWFNPVTAERGRPENFLVWNVGSSPLVKLSGSGRPILQFSTGVVERDVIEVAKGKAHWLGSSIIDLSLFGLPQETQNTYRILLTIPIGALLVVLLRNLVGVKTFGTFMPILISVAFIQTGLLSGVLLFSVLVAIGLMLRSYLDRLRLLLVPRLAAVLTIVVLLMIVVSVISYQIGSQKPLAITLFPMVILAMTIERMSLVWEEHGGPEAMTQAAGSLFTAIVGYFVISLSWVEHIVFVFPETLLIVLAAILLLGRYTGYRLTEMWRFRHSLQEQLAKS